VLRPLAAGVLTADEYAGQSLARWLDLVESLRDLITVADTLGPGEPLMPARGIRDLLEAVCLDVPAQKMRFQHVARTLTADLAPEIRAGPLTVKADVTRATGLAETFTTGYPRIGWQLQGDAFRLCVEPDPRLARDPGNWDQIEDQARCHAAFFDFTPVRDLIADAGPAIPASGSRPLAFRHFRPTLPTSASPASPSTRRAGSACSTHTAPSPNAHPPAARPAEIASVPVQMTMLVWGARRRAINGRHRATRSLTGRSIYLLELLSSNMGRRRTIVKASFASKESHWTIAIGGL
jgi:hypothetical protein